MLLPKGELTITIPRDGYLTSKRPGLDVRIENEARGLGDLLLHFGR